MELPAQRQGSGLDAGPKDRHLKSVAMVVVVGCHTLGTRTESVAVWCTGAQIQPSIYNCSIASFPTKVYFYNY